MLAIIFVDRFLGTVLVCYLRRGRNGWVADIAGNPRAVARPCCVAVILIGGVNNYNNWFFLVAHGENVGVRT